VSLSPHSVKENAVEEEKDSAALFRNSIVENFINSGKYQISHHKDGTSSNNSTSRKTRKIKKVIKKRVKSQDYAESPEKNEIPLEKENNEVKDKLCCYYCVHAKVNTCLECEKKCIILNCKDKLTIHFKKYCTEFEY